MPIDPATLLPAPLPASPESIGRFQVIGRLGQGAQSVVYLAYDPQLQREVALKAVRMELTGGRRAALLREARAVSRLSHPAIVPVFEAQDSEEGACLVFEYVAGRTLAERIEAEGAYAPAQAVALLLPVLDAVAYAHAQRIVHRDLKPSNILLDDAGQARVMDFGIAVRHDTHVDDDSDGRTAMLGTPAYMAPEYSGQGQVSPAMDIFAAGLVLYEMLCGQRAVGSQQGVAAIRHLLRKDVALPEDLPAPADEALRAIVNRALARDPQARQQSMAELAEALRRWLAPPARVPTAAEEMARAAALDGLLARMPTVWGFPTPAGALATPPLETGAQASDSNDLVALVLNEPSLTLLVLRQANAPPARAFGAAPVATVSKAIALLGLEQVRQAIQQQEALSEDGLDRPAARLKAQYAHARRVGLLARELSGLPGADGEEARIAGMLACLGGVALAAGLPQEAGPVLDVPPSGRVAQDRRARKLLGVGLDDLAGALAQAWGLPASLQRGLGGARPGDSAQLPATRDELLHAVAALADELADAAVLQDEEAQQAAVKAAVARHGAGLCLSPHEARKAMARAAGAELHLGCSTALRATRGA
jgi:HD-like signal output (HDOD) protein